MGLSSTSFAVRVGRLASLLVLILSAALALWGQLGAAALAALVAVAAAMSLRKAPHESRRVFGTSLFLTAFGIRALVAAAAYAAAQAAGRSGFIFDDDVAHDRWGWWLVEVWRGVAPPYEPQFAALNAYHYWTAGIYALVGRSPLTVEMANAVLGAALAVALYLFGRRWAGEAEGRLAGLLGAFFPSLVLWSALHLKEGLIWLAIVVALGGASALIARPRWPGLVVLVGGLLLLAHLRWSLFVILEWIVLGTFLAAATLPWRRRVIAAVGLTLVLSAVSWVSGLGVMGSGVLRSSPRSMAVDVVLHRNALRAGGSAYGAAFSTRPVAPATGILCRTTEEDVFDFSEPVRSRLAGLTFAELLDVQRELNALMPEVEWRFGDLSRLSREQRHRYEAAENMLQTLGRREKAGLCDLGVIREEEQIVRSLSDPRWVAHLVVDGLAHVVAAPFPWALPSSLLQFAVLELPFWWAALGLAVVGLPWALRARAWWPWWLFCAAAITLMTLVDANVGTLLRHRSAVYPIVLIIAAVGALRLQPRLRAVLGAGWAGK